jgi:hypothetical protein
MIAPRDYAVMPSRVLVALLNGTTEERYLGALRGMPSRIEEHRNRATVLVRLRMYRPTVLVLPLLDRRARPSSLLVEPCRLLLPSLRIVLISDAVSHSRHLLRALHQDVTVLIQPSEEQLRSVVLEAAFSARPALPDAHELFANVTPLFLRRVMEVAWTMSDQRVGLSVVASHIGTSTRTLEREAKRQKIAHPRDIMAAVRFLRAYAIAAASGPPGTRECLELLGEEGIVYTPSAPLPPLQRAVAHRVQALGGTLS